MPRVELPAELRPPAGWNILQKRAHDAKDPEELSLIITEMNKLLDAHLQYRAQGAPRQRPRESKRAGPVATKEVQS
jgi:hypothetical protein